MVKMRRKGAFLIDHTAAKDGLLVTAVVNSDRRDRLQSYPWAPFVWFAVHLLLVAVLARVPVPHTQYYTHLTHTFIDAFVQWDGVWYSLLGHFGYAIPLADQAPLALGGNPLPLAPLQGAAFFPLVPLVVHAFGTVLAVAVGNLVLLAALVIADRLFRNVLRPWEASVAVGLCALSPAMVFDSALYSDVYVIFFSLLCLFAVSRAVADANVGPYYHLLACAAAFGAGLSHELGVLVIIFGLRYLRLRQWLRAITYTVSTLAGWASFSAYLGVRFHAPLAMFRAERIWGHTWRIPGFSLFEQFLHLQQAPLLPLAALFATLLSVTYVLSVLWFARTGDVWAPHSGLTLRSLESGLFAFAWVLIGLTSYVPSTPISGVLRLLCMCWPALAGPLFWLPIASRRTAVVGVLFVSALFGCLLTVSFTHGYAVV
ncbi:hypothetical protein [Alicyclobacillus sp. ALC3]|uniref:hypothetical protein n=1 Tax=Alicyclobacillus sp. ALC3 TaxID=2796143 RepID=UPI0023783DD8|nr:hypothetical protein [Alicyclobacillus sp. ALC3]WDL98284.1 hypothetical protein JC200_06225 [Alicyclobacillus sp. ALC3]